ncbi:hypothetical protein VTO73DRAFT_8494 [Trametes versicolor]
MKVRKHMTADRVALDLTRNLTLGRNAHPARVHFPAQSETLSEYVSMRKYVHSALRANVHCAPAKINARLQRQGSLLPFWTTITPPT